MNCAMGCTICAARGRMPTHTPMGTQIRLASAIKHEHAQHGEQRQAAHLQGFVQRGVRRSRPPTMCHSPSTTAATISEHPQQIESSALAAPRPRLDAGASLRFTARLVHSTAE